MNEKLTLLEVRTLIQKMKSKLEERGQVTHVFKRSDYEKVLIILSDEEELLADKKVNVKVNFQHGVLTLSFRRSTLE